MPLWSKTVKPKWLSPEQKSRTSLTPQGWVLTHPNGDKEILVASDTLYTRTGTPIAAILVGSATVSSSITPPLKALTSALVGSSVVSSNLDTPNKTLSTAFAGTSTLTSYMDAPIKTLAAVLAGSSDMVSSLSSVSKDMAGVFAGTSNVVSSLNPGVPFTFDANTYFWDFAANDNEVDSLGTATVSRVKDRCGDKVTIREYNKAFQPVKVTGGVTFNQATGRRLSTSLPPKLANGKNGFYLAFVLTPTTSTNGNIMSISSASSTTTSRMWVDFTGSRNIRLRYGANDSSTLATIFSSAALTLGTKYAIEVLFDFDADTYTLWINGVNQNLAVSGGPWSNYPASDPREVLIGNNTNGTMSLDAVLNNIVFQDGVPSAAIRTSVSSFQQTRQTA